MWNKEKLYTEGTTKIEVVKKCLQSFYKQNCSSKKMSPSQEFERGPKVQSRSLPRVGLPCWTSLAWRALQVYFVEFVFVEIVFLVYSVKFVFVEIVF